MWGTAGSVTMMLCGLRSRWRTLWAWQWASASAIRRANWIASSTSSRPRWDTNSSSRVPTTSSMARKKRPSSVTPNFSTWTSDGWRSRVSASTSFCCQASCSARRRWAAMFDTLTAHGRPLGSVAR